MKDATKRRAVLAHMQQCGHITPLEAWQLYGCYRLAVIIYALRAMGYNIRTDYVQQHPGGARFADYYLIN